MLFGAAIGNILIDVSLALVAVVVGFIGALAYLKHIGLEGSHMPVGSLSPEEVEQAANEAERTSMAVDQVRDLTKGVAADVDQHSAVVQGINDELHAIDSQDDGSGMAVAAVVAKIVSANKQLQSRLEEAELKICNQAEELRTQETEARTDGLTQLANRRAFDLAMDEQINIYREQSLPFSMLLLDVDHFKQFNDTHGHQAGDEVLRVVGKTLKTIVKKTDSPCRYGGEEFAVVMPNTTASQGRVAAERVRKAIEDVLISFGDQSLRVTASVGIAQVGPDEKVEQVIRRADEAVYAAKAAGRNCCYWQDGVDCLPIDQESKQVPSPVKQASEKSKRTQKAAPIDVPLPDAAGFTGELSRRVAESHRFGVSLSVMHLRISEFAKLRNEYGDRVGELIFESVAGFIKSTLREMDLLGNLGEGDFAVMLPGSSENEAKMVGRRIQTAISNCQIPLGKTNVQLEIHLGVSNAQPDDDAQDVMSRARYLMEHVAKGQPLDV